ncbi:MAG: sugar nucleotide-binding protein [Ignavibacteriales bacterium]|nr:MAG: sugar nucleotide-binding protein [Ignavibacteriales bacterium]
MISSDNLIKKRILITGSNTVIGQGLVSFFARHLRVQVLATSLNPVNNIYEAEYLSCDITNRELFKRAALDFYPDVIINTADYNHPVKSDIEREKTWKINVKSLEFITEVARVLDSHIIQISTNRVFDGLKGPYSEKGIPNPSSYYERTKLAAENVLKLSGTIYTLVRISEVFGINRICKNDLLNEKIGQIKNDSIIHNEFDRITNPVFSDDVVQAISKIIEYKKTGIYHIGGKELISDFDFNKRIAVIFNIDTKYISNGNNSEHFTKSRLDQSLLTIKAETELGYSPHTLNDALTLIKKTLQP